LVKIDHVMTKPPWRWMTFLGHQFVIRRSWPCSQVVGDLWRRPSINQSNHQTSSLWPAAAADAAIIHLSFAVLSATQHNSVHVPLTSIIIHD